jgi:hypothetical protein
MREDQMPPIIPPDQQPNAPPPRGPHDHDTRPHGRTQQQPAAQRDNQSGEAASPHQRQGDRASADDTDDAERKLAERAAELAVRRSKLAQSGFPIFVRYADLEAAGFVGSWTQLLRMIDEDGFPPGTMLGRNTRAWRADEIEAWVASRPSARKIMPRDAVHPRIRDKRRIVEAQP